MFFDFHIKYQNKRTNLFFILVKSAYSKYFKHAH